MSFGWTYTKGLSFADMGVYNLLGNFGTYDAATNSYHRCRPARTTMARIGGCSVETLKRSLAHLVKAGLIERHERYSGDGTQLPSEYTIRCGEFKSPPTPSMSQFVEGVTSDPLTKGTNCNPSKHQNASTSIVSDINHFVEGVTGDPLPGSPVTQDPYSVNPEKTSSSSVVTSSTEEPQQKEEEEEEEEEDSPKKTEAEPSTEALDLIASLPAINGSRLSTKFAPRINDLLSNGWTPKAVYRNLTTGTNGANGAGIYASKLKDLPLSPPARIQPAPVAPTMARHPRTPYAPLKSHKELGVTRCEHDRVKAICPQCRGTATKTRQSRNAAKTTPPATHTAQEAVLGVLADTDTKVERCRLHGHSDALHCPSCWGVVKAGSDPYEGCEDQRPKGWNMVYTWSPSVKTVTMDETEVEPLNLPAAITAMLA
jgi:hypothetical protein